jgi:Na+/melibiose symporter-like transporter
MTQTCLTHSSFTHIITVISFFASAIGLFVLYYHEGIRNEDLDETQWMLFGMGFAYWMVHCVAIALVQWIPQDWVWLILNVKITAVASALLTFSCAMSLPLNRIAEENQTEEW